MVFKKFFIGVLEPLGPPYEHNEFFFYIWGVGYQNRVKGCVEFISEGTLGKYSKMKGLVINFGTPNTNFLALIKKIFLQTLIEIIFRYHSFIITVLGHQYCLPKAGGVSEFQFQG